MCKKIMRKGYCKIEDKETVFEKLPNGKWLCKSPNCSHAAGQYEKLPKVPETVIISNLKKCPPQCYAEVSGSYGV